MIQEAINKLRSEIDQTTNPMEKMLGQQIIDNITSTEKAQKILLDGKTLSGCKKTFDDYASKHKDENRSVIGPKDAEDLIFKYYGFEENAETIPAKKELEVINILDFV